MRELLWPAIERGLGIVRTAWFARRTRRLFVVDGEPCAPRIWSRTLASMPGGPLDIRQAWSDEPWELTEFAPGGLPVGSVRTDSTAGLLVVTERGVLECLLPPAHYDSRLDGPMKVLRGEPDRVLCADLSIYEDGWSVASVNGVDVGRRQFFATSTGLVERRSVSGGFARCSAGRTRAVFRWVSVYGGGLPEWRRYRGGGYVVASTDHFVRTTDAMAVHGLDGSTMLLRLKHARRDDLDRTAYVAPERATHDIVYGRTEVLYGRIGDCTAGTQVDAETLLMFGNYRPQLCVLRLLPTEEP